MLFKKKDDVWEVAPDILTKSISSGGLTDDGDFHIWFGGLFSKQVHNVFHVLFYVTLNTKKQDEHPTFICIDKVGGGIFCIKFESDHSGDSNYDDIRHYEKLSYEKFGEIVQNLDRCLPGLKETFGHLSSDNWKDFLSVHYDQPSDIDHAFLVINKKGDYVELMRYSAPMVEYCVCDRSDYDRWIAGRKYVTEDYLYFDKIIEFSKHNANKKCALIVRPNLFNKVLNMINAAYKEKSQSGNMDLICVKNKIFAHIEENVTDAEVEALFEEIKCDLQ